MSKKIFILVAAVAFLGLAIRPAAAEIKNLKVGGDIVIRGIYRDNIDFLEADGGTKDVGSWTMTQIRVYFSAELTDNVFGMVRVINERDWDAWKRGQYCPNMEENNIELDLAYIKVVDLLTPGLTLTLGRQEILLGKGFVVGNRYYDGTDLMCSSGYRKFAAPDLTARKAFDAVRADYEVGMYPLTLTAFGAKINDDLPGYSSSHEGERDTDLRGLNARFDIADNATIESYVLNVREKQDVRSVDIWTFGVRGDHEVLSVPGLAYSAEMAWQFGDLPGSEKEAKGYAGTLDVNYAFANPYEPKLGLAYTIYSGDKDSSDSDYKAWIPMFPDNLGDTIGRLTYAKLLTWGMSPTNLSVPKIYGSMKPAEKHTVSLSVFPATRWTQPMFSGAKKELGWGMDLGYNYQYTEDLSFGLVFDYAKAGKFFKDVFGDHIDDTSMQVIGTAALAF